MLPLRPGILDCTALWIRKKDGVLCCQGRAPPLQTETIPARTGALFIEYRYFCIRGT